MWPYFFLLFSLVIVVYVRNDTDDMERNLPGKQDSRTDGSPNAKPSINPEILSTTTEHVGTLSPAIAGRSILTLGREIVDSNFLEKLIGDSQPFPLITTLDPKYKAYSLKVKVNTSGSDEKVESYPVSWDDAKVYCETQHEKLATFDSVEDFMVIGLSLFSTALRDAHEINSYWFDGSKSKGAFSPNSLSPKTTETPCVAMTRSEDHFEGLWDEREPCDQKANFLCEVSGEHDRAINHVVTTGIRIGNTPFTFYRWRAPYSFASEVCKDSGTQLALFNTEEEFIEVGKGLGIHLDSFAADGNQTSLSLATVGFLIGLSALKDNDQFLWLDGSTPSFSPWMNSPMNLSAASDFHGFIDKCVAMVRLSTAPGSPENRKPSWDEENYIEPEEPLQNSDRWGGWRWKTMSCLDSSPFICKDTKN